MRKIYVQCNPLLDISAHVSDDLLRDFGLQAGSAAIAAAHHNGLLERIETAPDCKRLPGGSGLNTARVANWMSKRLTKIPSATAEDIGSRFSTETVFVGCIGQDEHGAFIKAAAEGEGLRMLLQTTSCAPTGTCCVCVTNKERTLVAAPGATFLLSIDFLQSEPIQATIRSASVVYVTGYALIVAVENILPVVEAAAVAGVPVVMNLSAPYISMPPFGDRLRRVLVYVNVLVANEEEAVAFIQANDDGSDSRWCCDSEDARSDDSKTVLMQKLAERLGNLLQQRYPLHSSADALFGSERVVIISRGPHPTVFWTVNGGADAICVPSVPFDHIVDTNGAGDAFVGGLLAAAVANCGTQLRDCIAAGHDAAAVIICQDGCTIPPSPLLGERQK